MSTQYQVTDTPGDFLRPLHDTTQHWKNIYDVDAMFRPIDRNLFLEVGRMGGFLLLRDHTYAWRGLPVSQTGT